MRRTFDVKVFGIQSEEGGRKITDVIDRALRDNGILASSIMITERTESSVNLSEEASER